MTNYISVIYVETETKLLGPIWPGTVYDETRWDNDVTDRTSAAYIENDIELWLSIRLVTNYGKNHIAQWHD